MSEVSERLQFAEQSIRQGDNAMALDVLRKLELRRVSRGQYQRLANLAWRVGIPNLALRLLGSYVYPEPGIDARATDAERLEYAIALMRVGGTAEAQDILRKIDGNTLHKAHLYYAFCAISQWDYTTAIEVLQKFLSQVGEGSYDWAVASTNLLASYVAVGDLDSGSRLFDRLHSLFLDLGYTRLLANLHELRCQSHFQSKEYDRIKVEAEKGRRLMSGDNSFAGLFFDKWSTLGEVFSSPTSANFQRLRELRKSAEGVRHWETVRDCDLYLAKLTHDEMLLRQVYFATPYASYRLRIQDMFQSEPVGETFTLHQRSMTRLYDVNFGTLDQEFIYSRPGDLLQRFMIGLARDLYKPIRIAALHSVLFPDEHFNVRSSPNRIHQLVFRLRKTLSDQGAPVVIEKLDSSYLLRVDTRLGLRLYETYELKSPVRKFFDASGAESVTATQLSEYLDCSVRSAQRALKADLGTGLVERVVINAKTHYKIAA